MPEHSPSSARSLLRRLARPLARPVDGRVADINRRVTDAHRSVTEHNAAIDERLAGLKNELDAYAAIAAESNSYVGVELRRQSELLDELRTDTDAREERYIARLDTLGRDAYVERLDHTSQAPLEHLDGAAARLVNHAGSHRGFAAQAGLWFNPPVTVELGEGDAHLASVNERIVEIPFAMSALAPLRPPARILDIGAAESTFSLSLASLGFRVTALDLHPLPYAHPNLEMVTGRFEDWDCGETRFDAVTLISTIEHFGLGAYGEPASRSEADRALLECLRHEILSEDGFVVLTTPYGPAKQDALERTYDDAALRALLDGWEVQERRVVLRRDARTWVPADDDSDGDAQGVVMLRATPSRTA